MEDQRFSIVRANSLYLGSRRGRLGTLVQEKNLFERYTLEKFDSCPSASKKDTGGDPTYAKAKTLLEELHDDHATLKTAVDETKTALDELIDDHATFKTVVDELTAWAETLATKMNLDAGITDADYDAVITADAPDTLAASKPTAGPATLTAGKPETAAGDENLLILNGNVFEYHVLGTQTIPAPVLVATGLDVGMDQTDNDGIEVSQGILARSKQAFVIGTDEFYAKLKFSIADISGTDDCAFGFRKAEAYRANIDDYADMAVLNAISGAITIETIVGAAATVPTDTTDTWGDGETHTLEVYVRKDGVVTYKIDGAAPTVIAAYTFTDALTVIPFFHYLHATTSPGAIILQEWECGLQ